MKIFSNKILPAALFFIASLGFFSCSKKSPAENVSENTAAYPQKIVSLAPAGTEILCAVGAIDQIVARTDFCDFPSAVKEKPSVGGFSAQNISIETIISHKPDLVYGAAGTHDSIKASLEEMGLTVELFDAVSVEAVEAEMRRIAKLTGHEAEGEAAAAKMEKVFADVKNLVKDSPVPNVYYEVWSKPYMSCGKNSFISGIIQSAGGNGIFSDQAEEYPMINEESIIAANPDVIIIPDMNGETKVSVEERSGWENMNAVKNSQIYFAESNIFSRAGPRITEALVAVAKMIHPEIDFSSVESDCVILADK